MTDEKADLLIRDRQLMDVLYKLRRLPDAELDQDIALVAHIMQHAEIAAQQLSVARLALGGISRNEFASDAVMAKATLETMGDLETLIIKVNAERSTEKNGNE